ncbi:hypothetical protein GCM10023085_06820 [Actinomadura viridis]|uniref:Uncharacterized protein n=1 Tax=Actinomadura viridis TaxID=58110 RepID=A0A931DPJ4_9ACTN|nr:hypothetical protein [Actinomadura viridis]MBG6091692.1 hypothetical protein [Actinomadura viridis]
MIKDVHYRTAPCPPCPRENRDRHAAERPVRTRCHRGAAADPRLPLETLLELLDDQKLAEPAATDPALPVETMHRLLDRAGVA